MGVKRPLGEENLPELSFKQPKQLDDINQTSTIMAHDLPTAVPRIDCPGEAKSNSCELQVNERLESGEALCASTADNELERMGDRVENLSEFEQHKQLDDNIEMLYVIAPLSLATTSSDEEDAGNEDTSFMHSFPGYADLSIPCRLQQQFEDPYVSSLNSSPSKEVPVGPDYQTELPNWDPSARGRDFSAPDIIFDDDRESKQLGTCIIPMPDSNISRFDESIVGRGRTDCSCVEVGSTRCVRRHVNEVRKNLRESLGGETFGELGFYNMGEEVARNWAANDERLFHEIIVSNPPSRGRDFWELLVFVFPNRTKREIVSYYFNVFMLRRRAVQNRSYAFCADSDDDENAHVEHCPNISLCNQDSGDDDDGGGDDNDLSRTYEDFYLVGEEDEDSTFESIGDQHFGAGWVDDYGPGPKNVGGEEGSDNYRATVKVDKGYDFEMGGGKGEFLRRDQEVKHD